MSLSVNAKKEINTHLNRICSKKNTSVKLQINLKPIQAIQMNKKKIWDGFSKLINIK